MPAIDPTFVIRETRAERTRLADLLTDLTAEQWSADSLCAGWRVREVVAHMTMPFRTSVPGFVVGMVRARMNFNRFADRDAHSTTQRMADAELLDLLRGNIDHQWKPPGGGVVGALSHDTIHGLDFTVPLGLPGPPPARIATILASAKPGQFEYFGVDLAATRLVATDADVAIGNGTVHHLPAVDILLIATGRRSVSDVSG